jgi:MSHA pilin protein MshD
MRSRGVTLVELVVTIVVVATAVSAVLGVLSAAAARSGDEIVQQQATLVADSYLNEILEKPFGVSCPGCARNQLAAVGDYDRLRNVGVRDENNIPVRTLSSYTVTVSVRASALGSIPAAQSQLVTVTVVGPTGTQVVLSGYRTLYP